MSDARPDRFDAVQVLPHKKGACAPASKVDTVSWERQQYGRHDRHLQCADELVVFVWLARPTAGLLPRCNFFVWFDGAGPGHCTPWLGFCDRCLSSNAITSLPAGSSTSLTRVYVANLSVRLLCLVLMVVRAVAVVL